MLVLELSVYFAVFLQPLPHRDSNTGLGSCENLVPSERHFWVDRCESIFCTRMVCNEIVEVDSIQWAAGKLPECCLCHPN